MMKGILLLMVAVWGWMGVSALRAETSGEGTNEAVTAWEKGLVAYGEGDDEGAIRAWELHLAQGHRGAEVYFNLGLAQARAGKVGEAVLSYLRALALNPSLQEARVALDKLAREQGLVLPPVQQPEVWVGLFGANPFWIVGSVMGWAGAFLLAWGFFRGRPKLPWLSVGVVLLLFSGASLGVAKMGDPLVADAGLAVVLTGGENGKGGLALRGSPADGSGAIEQMAVGSVVEVVSLRGKWAYVLSPTRKMGWVPQSAVELVIPMGAAAGPPTAPVPE